MEHITKQQVTRFQATVLNYYAANKRTMPWRIPDSSGRYDPYKIMVSEIMLQQTQAARVEPKYNAFLQLFPTIQDLATADLHAVLVIWSGLGYNRRAKYLWQAARVVIDRFNGVMPHAMPELVSLPGIGHNTAGAIIAYSYDKPIAYIETNIRTVYLHEFFGDATGVSDAAILTLVTVTVPTHHIRDWYYALMDYGAYLKTSGNTSHTRALRYGKQSTFAGSQRQLRGAVLRSLAQEPCTAATLRKRHSDNRLTRVLLALQDEQLIHKKGSTFFLG